MSKTGCENLSHEELRKAIRKATRKLLDDPHKDISTSDPDYDRWSRLLNEERNRRALA